MYVAGGARYPDKQAGRTTVVAEGDVRHKKGRESIGTLKTAWTKVRKNAKVIGRWHDNRHTLVTELAESGAGDEVIMSIAGLVSRAMLSRYSHVRMEAKRHALDEIALRREPPTRSFLRKRSTGN